MQWLYLNIMLLTKLWFEQRKVNLKIFKGKLIDVKLCLSHYLRNQFLHWTTYFFQIVEFLFHVDPRYINEESR